MSLRRFFIPKETRNRSYRWIRQDHDISVGLSNELADALADLIVRHRCRRCIHHYDAWRAAADGGARPTGTDAAGLHAWLDPVFGIPGATPKPVDHVEGFVAEHLWYFMMKESVDHDPIVRIEAPGFKATDPGGDSLVIHRRGDGVLTFSIWEIKKSTGKKKATTTINKALRQLSAKAVEYLARYACSTDTLSDPDLEGLYCRMMEYWGEGSPLAAAGVSVATSTHLTTVKCFQTFPKHFPALTSPPRLCGLLTVVGDFVTFAAEVRDRVWKGL
jgi:hypothetical protein